MDNKTLSIISYLTLIGWLVAYFVGKEKADSLLKYHLRQSIGLFITIFVLNICFSIIAAIVPSLGLILSSLAYLVYLVFLVIGILNANKSLETPLPLVGKYFEKK